LSHDKTSTFKDICIQRFVDSHVAEGQNVEGQNVEGQNVKGQNVEGQNVDFLKYLQK
jgi:hypothetical protein